jgi:hypothetical protein
MLEMILGPIIEFLFELIFGLVVAGLIEAARNIRDDIQEQKHSGCTLVQLNLR